QTCALPIFFYALENTLLPTILNVLSVFGINILVISLFLDEWGSLAIALGTVISAFVNMFLLIFFAKVNLKLVVSKWAYIFKLAVFILIIIAILWLTTLVPFGIFFSLITGGLVTLGLICGGLRVIK